MYIYISNWTIFNQMQEVTTKLRHLLIHCKMYFHKIKLFIVLWPENISKLSFNHLTKTMQPRHK